jgi:DNA mismatch repair protein MSH5
MSSKRRRYNFESSSCPPLSSKSPSLLPFSAPPKDIPPSSPASPLHAAQNRSSLNLPGPRIFALSLSNQDEHILKAAAFERDGGSDLSEELEDGNEIVMAVDLREHGTIGCAYHVTREETLYLMEDIKMASVDIIDMLKVHTQPTLIIISNRSDDELEEHLSKDARGIDRGDEGSKSTLSTIIAGLTYNLQTVYLDPISWNHVLPVISTLIQPRSN